MFSLIILNLFSFDDTLKHTFYAKISELYSAIHKCQLFLKKLVELWQLDLIILPKICAELLTFDPFRRYVVKFFRSHDFSSNRIKWLLIRVLLLSGSRLDGMTFHGGRLQHD